MSQRLSKIINYAFYYYYFFFFGENKVGEIKWRGDNKIEHTKELENMFWGLLLDEKNEGLDRELESMLILFYSGLIILVRGKRN